MSQSRSDYTRVTVLTDERADTRQRLLSATVSVLLLLIFGSTGYYIIGRGEWSAFDCVYMTVITLTTVGYREAVPVEGNEAAQMFTILLLIMGMGIVLYFVSSLTAFIIEGELNHIVRRRRMLKQIEELDQHYIICGLGNTGEHVAEELHLSQAPMVVIEKNVEAIERMQTLLGQEVPHIVGDATEDDVLEQAGITRCIGAVISLGNDRDNLFCTISARTLNPKIRIVTKGADPRSEQKFMKAGADRVVFTTKIGGLRMASEVLRPHVVTFLDLMTRDKDRTLRIEEVHIREESVVAHRTLAEADLRRQADILVVAVKNSATGRYDFSPPPTFRIEPGHILIVLGDVQEVKKFRNRLAAAS